MKATNVINDVLQAFLYIFKYPYTALSVNQQLTDKCFHPCIWWSAKSRYQYIVLFLLSVYQYLINTSAYWDALCEILCMYTLWLMFSSV